MSGAANQGAWSNPGTGHGWGQSPWGPGAGVDNRTNGHNFGWQHGAWVPWWAMSRPLLILATITGFLIWWPVGLALLIFAVYNKRMRRFACAGSENAQQGGDAQQGGGNGAAWWGPWAGWSGGRCGGGGRAQRSSGNRAFDDYREQTLHRLEEEQREFAAFLDRLRVAKDKSEFDQFMADRRHNPPAPTGDAPNPDQHN